MIRKEFFKQFNISFMYFWLASTKKKEKKNFKLLLIAAIYKEYFRNECEHNLLDKKRSWKIIAKEVKLKNIIKQEKKKKIKAYD